VRHIVKTTIEISDALLAEAKRLARKEKTTFRVLTEEGLRRVISEKHARRGKKLSPLVSSGGDGLTNDFKDSNWHQIRDEIYGGRGT
jgi:thiamine monophosphate kinase